MRRNIVKTFFQLLLVAVEIFTTFEVIVCDPKRNKLIRALTMRTKTSTRTGQSSLSASLNILLILLAPDGAFTTLAIFAQGGGEFIVDYKVIMKC